MIAVTYADVAAVTAIVAIETATCLVLIAVRAFKMRKS